MSLQTYLGGLQAVFGAQFSFKSYVFRQSTCLTRALTGARRRNRQLGDSIEDSSKRSQCRDGYGVEAL